MGDTRAIADLFPTLRACGIRGVPATAVLGDPTIADVDSGRSQLRELIDALVAHLADWLNEAIDPWPTDAFTVSAWPR